MKVVIFGGTFDPWSSAHQEIVERLASNYSKVIVVPTTVRYYKVNKQMFSFNERYSMAKNKVSSISNVEVSDIERSVDENWRFVNTLEKIVELNGNDNEYYVAIGSDSLQNFKTWYEWEKILNLAKLVVFNRPGYTDNFPDIEYEYLPMENTISSTKLRNKLIRIMSDEEFEDLLDEDWLIKGQKNLEDS